MGRYESFGRAMDRCESFIERRFLAALLFSERFTFDAKDVGVAEDTDGIILGQQVIIGEYRVDFAMKRRGFDSIRLAIELDGHRFHGASADQVTRDRARDRDVTSKDWRIVRFTSREVIADAMLCAEEARNIVMTLTSNAERLAPLAKTNGVVRQLAIRTG